MAGTGTLAAASRLHALRAGAGRVVTSSSASCHRSRTQQAHRALLHAAGQQAHRTTSAALPVLRHTACTSSIGPSSSNATTTSGAAAPADQFRLPTSIDGRSYSTLSPHTGGRGSALSRCLEKNNNGPLRQSLQQEVPALVANGIGGIYARHTLGRKERSYSTGANDSLLVVGSGVAGCAAALIAAQTHRIPVTLLFAGSAPTDCNSYWAQGGIIYRNYDPASGDSAQLLADDIHRAGAGLCVDEAVWKVATEGPDRVKELLLDDGGADSPSGGTFANVPFDRNPDGTLSHCLEASHAAARILHRADSTGAAITQHITQAAISHPLVTVVSDTIVTDLAVATDDSTGNQICVGAHVLNRETRASSTIRATRGVLLASGGLAGIYEHSTNPPGFNALGSSTAIADRAGVQTKDLEYVQFHPTSLYLPNEARFLLTEALRGEGAILRDADGRAFARDFHVDGELAPRDVVARGVYAEAQKSNGDGTHNAYLDVTHRDAEWLRNRFPTIDAHLSKRNIDITRDQLPVIPAAHYTCGGIETDLHGRTSLMGLYSAGEAARTGLHGGNRLASTSLLEGLVYGAAVADFVGGAVSGNTKERVSSSLASEEAFEMARSALASPASLEELRYHYQVNGGGRPDNVLVNGEAQICIDGADSLLGRIKKTMWDGVGVVRTPSGMATALEDLIDMKGEANELYRLCPTYETAAVRDAAVAGEAVARAALRNRVSRGAHTVMLDEEDQYGEDSDDEIVAAQAAGV